jgi:hypothetical protein
MAGEGVVLHPMRHDLRALLQRMGSKLDVIALNAMLVMRKSATTRLLIRLEKSDLGV